MFGSALAGRCEKAPEAAARPMPLVGRLAALPCRGGDTLRRALFEPLGYEVDDHKHYFVRRTHECVFGVLALESEPVDPRL